jgi:hypothetical protein
VFGGWGGDQGYDDDEVEQHGVLKKVDAELEMPASTGIHTQKPRISCDERQSLVSTDSKKDASRH